MLDPLEGESAMIIEGLLPCNVNSKVNFWEDSMILGGKKLNSESSFLQAWQTCLQSETLKMFLCSYISISLSLKLAVQIALIFSEKTSTIKIHRQKHCLIAKTQNCKNNRPG